MALKPLARFESSRWGVLALFILFSCMALAGFTALLVWPVEKPVLSAAILTPTTTSLPTINATPETTSTLPPRPSPASSTSSPTPTPTNTRVVAVQVDYAGTAQSSQRATIEASNKALVLAHLQALNRGRRRLESQSLSYLSYSQSSPLVLAHYFAWYNGDGWADCAISAGDKPLTPYHSDDPAAIARHIALAQEIGLNGFTLHWFAPGDRTDRNFGTLLTLAEGTDFAATVVFSRHIFHGGPATFQSVTEALRYIIEQYGRHPNFLRLDQKPVIFFTDVYRTPGGGSPQQFWATLRAEVDPEQQTWWVAEGLDTSYLEVFDGLYVFKISHAAYPHDYLKSPRWGRRVRAMAEQTGQPKLWAATISPGWDDRRSACRADVRVPSPPHKLDRAEGATYQATFEAALASEPDWLMVSSFNEWVEGSYIEPSEQYGQKYVDMTREFVEEFQDKKKE